MLVSDPMIIRMTLLITSLAMAKFQFSAFWVAKAKKLMMLILMDL
jgi:hypothetical protein